MQAVHLTRIRRIKSYDERDHIENIYNYLDKLCEETERHINNLAKEGESSGNNN